MRSQAEGASQRLEGRDVRAEGGLRAAVRRVGTCSIAHGRRAAVVK